MRLSFAWRGGFVVACLFAGVLLATPVALAQPGPDDDPMGDLLDEPPPPRPEDDDFAGPPENGGWGEARRGNPGVMLWNRMSDDEKKALREFMAEEYPEMYDRIADVLDRDGNRLRGPIGRVLSKMIEMKELHDRDAELFKVVKGEQLAELELRHLARRYRFADSDEDRAKLAAKIRPLVEKQFDARQRRMTEEVTRLEERIAKVRERIQRQADNREAEVDKMYQRILEGGPESLLDEGERPIEGKRRGAREGRPRDDRPREGRRGRPADDQ